MMPRKSSKSYNKAKNKLAHWLDITGMDTAKRREVLQAFDRLRDELAQRDAWFDVTTVSLDRTNGLRADVAKPRIRIGAWRGGLLVATITPGWGVGWSKIFKDNEVYDLLSWLMHYVRQYVHRSLIVGVLMSLWEQHELLLHPLGSRIQIQRWGPMIPIIPQDKALANAIHNAEKTWSEPPFPEVNGAHCNTSSGPVFKAKHLDISSVWLERNTLDPHVHQGVFQMLRAIALEHAGFSMEAVVAFDCVLEVAIKFLQTRGIILKGPNHRYECASFFGLGDELKDAAHMVGFMRNHFGAHAGGWRWWDFHEMFEDELDNAAALAGAVLNGMADIEPQYRLVEPAPEKWSEWFWINFDHLWRAVWFEALTTWRTNW